jgi:hypothetical protein
VEFDAGIEQGSLAFLLGFTSLKKTMATFSPTCKDGEHRFCDKMGRRYLALGKVNVRS